jgi:hypothetical protein
MSLGRSNKSAWADDKNSELMRSLEKVAREKGWAETKPITKSASSKLNLSPGSNLTENILKLCAGLRQSGLEKYALDIENKFVVFKQAAHLYDATGETGDDLVDAAHSKGSHKMEGLDNAVFKTILDRHLDMLNLVNKKPSGKLSNAKDILKAVKIVLADGPVAEAPSREALEQVVNSSLAEGLRRWNAIDNIINKDGGLTHIIGRGTDYSIHSSFIKDLFIERPATLDKLDSLRSRIKSALATIKPGISLSGGSFNPFGGVSKDVYSTVTPIIETLNAFVDKAYDARVKLNAITTKGVIEEDKPVAPPASKTNEGLKEFSDKAAELIKKLNGSLSVIAGPGFTENDRAKMNPKIKEHVDNIQALLNHYNDPKTDKEAAAPGYLKRLAAHEAWLGQLNAWMTS